MTWKVTFSDGASFEFERIGLAAQVDFEREYDRPASTMFGQEQSREEWTMFGCYRQLARMGKITDDFESFVNRDPLIEFELSAEALKAIEEAAKEEAKEEASPKATGGRRSSSSASRSAKARPRKHS